MNLLHRLWKSIERQRPTQGVGFSIQKRQCGWEQCGIQCPFHLISREVEMDYRVIGGKLEDASQRDLDHIDRSEGFRDVPKVQFPQDLDFCNDERFHILW
uniref:Uncharacterized protein n=1 Tax=Paramoeba aestuarina TaxID=180227 RepID=A0A7S4KLH5_9EUKA